MPGATARLGVEKSVLNNDDPRQRTADKQIDVTLSSVILCLTLWSFCILRESNLV
jgi:hypothetical protein